jgi:hypothetical protein
LFAIRRNGRIFYIEFSLSQFTKSPAMTEKYLLHLEVLRSGERVIGDIFDTDVADWLIPPFEPFFAQLAPDPKIPAADLKVTLKEHLHPEFFVLTLDVVDEELRPRRVEMEKSPCTAGGVWLDD